MTMNAESRFQMSGSPTLEEASLLVNRVPQEVYDEVKVVYEEEGTWGADKLPAKEAEEYLEDLAPSDAPDQYIQAELSVQPTEKKDETRYFTEAPEDFGEEFHSTQLPNPVKMRLEGDIEASAGYDDRLLYLDIEVDDIKREDMTGGTLRIKYSGSYETDAENELQRTREVMEHLDGLGSMLE